MLIDIREFEDMTHGEGAARDFQHIGTRWVRVSEIRSLRTFDSGGRYVQFCEHTRVEIVGPHGTNYEFWTDEAAFEIVDRMKGKA